MKKILIMTACLAALCNASCVKESAGRTAAEDKEKSTDSEIIFDAGGLGIDVETKATVVNIDNLPEFNVIAATGSDGAETVAWSTVARKVLGYKFSTGKYWPAVNPNYHFYASNSDIVMESGSPKVTADVSSNKDIVVASSKTPSFPAQLIPLSFIHLFSKLGEVTISSDKGYTLTDISLRLVNAKTGGKWNLNTSSWDESAYTVDPSLPIAVGNNDILVVPGAVRVEATLKMNKGDYSSEFTFGANVQLVQGKVCNLELNVPQDPAVPIVLNVTIADWQSTKLPLTLQ
jgi:hypothetical protein